MSDDPASPCLLLPVGREKVTAAFDGGRVTADGGVMLLASVDAADDTLGDDQELHISVGDL
jgi:hypothetical protein